MTPAGSRYAPAGTMNCPAPAIPAFGAGFSGTISGAFSAAVSAVFSGAFPGALSSAFSGAFCSWTAGVLGVTLGVNPVSSSPGMRTLTGGALPFGSESNTIGSTMTAPSQSAMGPTSRPRPRRGVVFNDGGLDLHVEKNTGKKASISPTRPGQRRQVPTRDSRRHRAHHAGDILIPEHAENGDRLGRKAALCEICRQHGRRFRVMRDVEDHLRPSGQDLEPTRQSEL